MLDCFIFVLLGGLLFGAGFLAGVLWERSRHVPPGEGDGGGESLRRAAL